MYTHGAIFFSIAIVLLLIRVYLDIIPAAQFGPRITPEAPRPKLYLCIVHYN